MLKEKGFYKGVNFGGWLSQCDYSEKHLNSFITEIDFKTAAEWGIDHIRIPVDYNILENNDGTYREDGFERLERAVELCRKYGLNMVLDLHKTAGFSFDYYGENESGFFDSEELQERFYRLWEQIAGRFGRYEDSVAFELLNEITDRAFIDAWNKIARKCVTRIRKFAPETIILIGSYWNNSPEAVKDLDAPYDEKIVYNMHCYDPLKFTHQGAYWTNQIDPNERLSFEEAKITPELFENSFKTALTKTEECGTELYCGEYGVIDRAEPNDVLEWFRCINSVFEKHKIARCAWNYKEMDFGLSDRRLDSIRDELVKYL